MIRKSIKSRRARETRLKIYGITSICFALMHAFNPEVQKLGNTLLIYYFLTGIFLGIITLMDDGLELAIGYHTANNFFTAILISNDWQAFQTDAVFMDYSEPSSVSSLPSSSLSSSSVCRYP